MSSSEEPRVVLVLTTLGADSDAAAFARTLVGEQLAACVSILPPMRSVYRWKGQVEDAQEQQLLIKTSAPCLEALQARLLALHPYETPELIVLEAAGSVAYLRWLNDSTA